MAFTGKTAYTKFNEQAEDVSDLMHMVSVVETPLLDFLGDSGIQARNVLHEWEEDALNPHVATLTANVASTAAAGNGMGVTSNSHIRVGMVVQFDTDGKSVHEQALVTSKAGANTIYLDRAAAGTNATSHATNDAMRLISSGALDGDDAGEDISTNRARLSNWTQIFERTVAISGSKESVVNLAGVSSEVDHQEMQRIRELAREYNQAIIAGRTLGNTIGTSTGRRFMAGLQGSITMTRSIGTLTASFTDNLVEDVWAQGGDADMIVCGSTLKRRINGFQGSAVRATQSEREFVRQIEEYSGFRGTQRILLDRYVDPDKLIVGTKSHIRTVPLRSFQATTLGKTGDSVKRQIVGEYTLELGTTKSISMGTDAN